VGFRRLVFARLTSPACCRVIYFSDTAPTLFPRPQVALVISGLVKFRLRSCVAKLRRPPSISLGRRPNISGVRRSRLLSERLLCHRLAHRLSRLLLLRGAELLKRLCHLQRELKECSFHRAIPISRSQRRSSAVNKSRVLFLQGAHTSLFRLRVDLPHLEQIGNPWSVLYEGSSHSPAEGGLLISTFAIFSRLIRLDFNLRVLRGCDCDSDPEEVHVEQFASLRISHNDICRRFCLDLHDSKCV